MKCSLSLEKNTFIKWQNVTLFLGNGVDGSLIADDLAKYIATWNQRVAARALQGMTNKLDAWATKKGLKFPSSKTVSMIFRKRNEEPIEILLGNKIIPSKQSTQFLWMTLDSRLNLEEHLNKLWAKAKGALNTIKVVAGKNAKEIEKS